MAVYIDTNIVRSGGLDALKITTLRAAAAGLGQNVIMPAVVADELEAHRLMEIEASFDQLARAHRDASRFASVGGTPVLPIPGELAREYRRSVERKFTVVATPPGAGDEALRREALRLRPARGGRGARDTAIWLTVRDHHTASGEVGYFISENVSDFAGTGIPVDLHPDLRGELRGSGSQHLHYFRDVETFLPLVSAPIAVFVDVPFLNGSLAVIEAVRGLALDRAFLRRIPIPDGFPKGGVDGAVLFAASPVGARAERLQEAQAFSIGGADVAVISGHWRLSLDLGALRRAGRAPVQETVRVECMCEAQLWISREAVGDELVSIGAVKAVWTP